MGARNTVKKTQVRHSSVFFTVFLAPILAVLAVSGWGLVVWMYQLFAGPPTY